MTIVGSYHQKSHGRLLLNVLSGKHHDALVVHGSVALNGTLTVVDKDHSHPGTGTRVRGALTAKHRTGKFHHVVSKHHPRKHQWHTTYTGHRIDLALH